MSLAECRSYGRLSSSVALKLPGMMFYAAVPEARNVGGTPGTTLVAFNDGPSGGSAAASVTLSVAAASSTQARIREGIWKANIGESSQWDVDPVARAAITVSATADTAQAGDVSHSTFTTRHGARSAMFDYWAFGANNQRYLLSYARLPSFTTPDAATFFATATSCPKS